LAFVEDWDGMRIQDFVEKYALDPGSVLYDPDEPHEKFSDKTSKNQFRGPRNSCSLYTPAS
jgi:hypothetical protein